MQVLEKYNNYIDDKVDEEILKCLDLNNPKSFFLFAGAGSGKTKSLVNVLKELRKSYGLQLRRKRQKIASITYTNAACKEIEHRLDNDSLFFVSTIHSFVWDLIKPHQEDIRNWLNENISQEIQSLKEKQVKGRPGTKASIDRSNKIESKSKRLKNLDSIIKFNYNPDGSNTTRGSLNHSEVIKIGVNFLYNKHLFQKILIQKYPILLIDESQDTNKGLIEALIFIQQKHKSNFSLGLFGDTMQRIYGDGKENLATSIPNDWIKPEKKMNHRSPKRIIALLNKIRSQVDSQKQLPRTEKEEGFLKLFIVDSRVESKSKTEDSVINEMKILTKDRLWSKDSGEFKTLTLEHHMAAKRKGFYNLFMPLYKVDHTSLLDGSMPELNFFTNIVLPLVKAKKDGDEYKVMRVIEKYSKFLELENVKKYNNQFEVLKYASTAVNNFYLLWEKDGNPKLIDVLNSIYKESLFTIPERLMPIVLRTNKEKETINSQKEKSEDNDKIIDAWDEALSAEFNELMAYEQYISDNTEFGTHQGVKGLQFDRVLVILDDYDARGFLFSYEKLLGAKELTKSDLKNMQEEKETGIDRTRRLFYVTCSRAIKSLAIIAYSNNPVLIKSHVKRAGWFSDEEIEIINK